MARGRSAVPAFAQRVRTLFDARRHKTIAAVRADGSPRISGIEVTLDEGEPAADEEPAQGRRPAERSAIAGESSGDRFHVDVTAVVHAHLDERATMLVVEGWTPSGGPRRVGRA